MARGVSGELRRAGEKAREERAERARRRGVVVLGGRELKVRRQGEMLRSSVHICHESSCLQILCLHNTF